MNLQGNRDPGKQPKCAVAMEAGSHTPPLGARETGREAFQTVEKRASLVCGRLSCLVLNKSSEGTRAKTRAVGCELSCYHLSAEPVSFALLY